MKVHFVTPNKISLINLTTIGDSEKREDETKIGKFSSGQAYATALLLRDDVIMDVKIIGETVEYITYGTKVLSCESTGKSKQVITLNYVKDEEFKNIETAFALQLGYNWELWMALRELWSNVLDEGGYVTEEEITLGSGTVITLDFNEDNEFYEVWQNRHLYINESEPLFKVCDELEVFENPEGYLRIYKQNILVYEDKKQPSKFAWNIKFGDIDERRILSNLYSVSEEIVSKIMRTKNEEFLRCIIKNEFELDLENEFLNNKSTYATPSELMHNIATEVYEEFGEVQSYIWLLTAIRELPNCKIGNKKIRSLQDSLWSLSTNTTVESVPQTISTPEVLETEEEIFYDAFAFEVKKFYNFKLDVEVRKAKLKGSKVIADKYENCLIISEDFQIEEDFPQFLIQYIDLTKKGNVVTELSKFTCDLLRIANKALH